MSDRLLVLVRHGQSEWNLKNLFTGWKDPDLTEQGIAEAKDAGRKLKAQGLSFDIAFTSVLKRAQHTLDLTLAEIGQTGIPIRKHLALNERDYGDLSGLNKDDARKKWGEEQVHVWRRSYDVPPPGGESLKDTLARTLPYYVQEILPCVLRGERTLVAAHGNSLRALIMVLEKLTPEGNSGARTRHRRADHLPPQRRRHGGLEARSGGVSMPPSVQDGVERPGIITFRAMIGLARRHRSGMTRQSMHPDLPGFPAEHRLLAGDAPVIAGQRAALAERAMAGHHERHRIFSDRGADRARGLGAFDLAGDVRIDTARPIGIFNSVSHTRTSKSVPIRTTRSGWSARHSLVSKMRCASAAVPSRSSTIGRARPAPLHVGERGLLLAGIGEGKAGQPAAAGDHDRGAERRGMESVSAASCRRRRSSIRPATSPHG